MARKGSFDSVKSRFIKDSVADKSQQLTYIYLLNITQIYEAFT